MEETPKMSSLTIEQLLANGWVKDENDPIFPIKKCLSDKESPDYDPESGDLFLVVHGLKNQPLVGLLLPDGAVITINPNSLEELNAFEAQIIDYEPPY